MPWYGKKNRPARDTSGPGSVHGRVIAGQVQLVPTVVRSAEPIGTAMMASLGLASSTMSPMSAGTSGPVSQSIGAGVVGRDARRGPALQNMTGLHRPLARPYGSALGAQGGPSSPAAFPSTGTSTQPSVLASLAGMGLPQVLRTPGVGS